MSFSFYPPGHGDIYRSFYSSGLLQKFIDDGKEFVFVSNIDNLGATVDINILWYILILTSYICTLFFQNIIIVVKISENFL